MKHQSCLAVSNTRSATRLIAAALAFISFSIVTEIAHAQSVIDQQFSPNPADQSGWWSPEDAASRTIPPSLLARADRTHFIIPAAPRWPGEIAFHRTNAERTAFKTWVDGLILHPRTLTYSLASSYQLWESNLAESHPRMNLNGESAYALMQFNVMSVQLPVGLYVPPLRGTISTLR